MPQPENENSATQALSAEVELVAADFQRRTLDELGGMFNRLIYLASLRDYSTGRYHHYGLETRYSSQAVDQALRQCHVKIFEELVALPLATQTQDLISFFSSLREEKSRLVAAWQRLRSYKILTPEGCHPLARELFDKNLEIMLGVLRETELWPLLDDAHGDPDNLP
jgi:hypothetical protein